MAILPSLLWLSHDFHFSAKRAPCVCSAVDEHFYIVVPPQSVLFVRWGAPVALAATFIGEFAGATVSGR